ncbi:MAG TPA: M1 family aminopeptidase, partial [Terriglobales bacterium]|nr:M1 family aminopeptidase [Terriglobales bacterium]
RRASEGDALPIQGGFHGGSAALGTMSTTGLNKKALGEAEFAAQVYTEYFGATSYKRLAITQQSACNYGQSWPTLVWIPICYYFDTTIRHQLGLDQADRGYWRSVTAHEVAHQWWGQTVGFSSYRDQWMSEGFAELSASIFLQAAYAKEPKRYLDFWNDERELLTQRNKEGFRAIDAGPVTLGYRLSNSRSGYNLTRYLIYPKGAYILQMVRMMMWDRRTGDQNFKATMQDFVKTYANQAATTEDFKAMVEKHMTKEMDLEGNHRMDWFFREYVYGTALPSYKFDYNFEKNADGDVVLGFKATQSNVDENFRMLVPIYLEMADGRVINLGRASLKGNSSLDQKVSLKGLKDTPRRAMLNYNYDVLSSAN